MAKIHPTAIVDPAAQLAEGVEIGAYCIVKGAVTIGAGTVVHEHSHLHGHTLIGAGCRIGPTAFVGLEPQHLRHRDDPNNPTYLVIENEVVIREMASIHRATKPGVEQATRVGTRSFLMGAIHVGHDCVLGEEVIMANGALLGGHCVIGPKAFLGGGCTLHQFVRIGRLAMISGNEPLTKEVPPFGALKEHRLKGYNAVGCRRAGLSREAIASIRSAYRLLHAYRSVHDIVTAIEAQVEKTPEVLEIVEFIRTSKRGIMPRRGDGAALDAD